MKPIEYLNKLSFPRMGGSENERKAAEMIAGWMREFGYETRLEPFEIYSFKPGKGTLLPISPSAEPIEVKPVGLSADGDVEGEIFILSVPEPEWADPADLANKIVFTQFHPRRKWLELLMSGGAAAALTVLPNYQESSTLKLQQSVAKDFGDKIPLATIAYKHAVSLLQREIKKAKLSVSHNKFIATSHNVVAESPGETDKIIILTAHYDSTPCSPGAQDNAAGTVELLELARLLAGKKFQRRIRFIFCGSEEMGLAGSEHHSSMHIEELKNVDFLINLDVGGDPFSSVRIPIIGTDITVHFIESILRQSGYAAKVLGEIYSSDNMPFSRLGVPSLSIARECIDGKIHSQSDLPDNVANEALMGVVNVARTIVSNIADAKILPFKREISDEMKKKVDKYFEDRR